MWIMENPHLWLAEMDNISEQDTAILASWEDHWNPHVNPGCLERVK